MENIIRIALAQRHASQYAQWYTLHKTYIKCCAQNPGVTTRKFLASFKTAFVAAAA